MATFYYEYADFLIKKMESNIDIFNSGKMPNDQQDK
jgi:hypothetical protein